MFSASNSTPFQADSLEETFEQIKNCVFSFDADVPDVAQDLIKKLIVKNPSKRLGTTCMDDLLSHPFFEKVEFDTLYSMEPPLRRKEFSAQ